jgi:hypothetical protein
MFKNSFSKLSKIANYVIAASIALESFTLDVSKKYDDLQKNYQDVSSKSFNHHYKNQFKEINNLALDVTDAFYWFSNKTSSLEDLINDYSYNVFKSPKDILDDKSLTWDKRKKSLENYLRHNNLSKKEAIDLKNALSNKKYLRYNKKQTYASLNNMLNSYL